MANTEKIKELVHKICREGFIHEFGKAEIELCDSDVWQKVRGAKTRLWLDTGDIEVAEKIWCSQFEALTTNNTLLNREVQKGIYDKLIESTASALRKAVPDIGQKELLLEVAFVLNAYHALRLVDIFDANVSVELHTDLANDVAASVSCAQRYYQICPERFYIKIPLTPAGFLAARKLHEQNIPVNFTLGFSARQNYFASLFAKPAYLNVFLGRLNAFVASNKLGDGENVGEKVTLATQRELLKLRESGSTESMLIAASMRNGGQVPCLAGVDVFTMPPKVAAEYQENPAETLSPDIEKDPQVTLNDSVDFDDFNASTLWDVPKLFKNCVSQLLRQDINMLTPELIQIHFTGAGFADFLPRWSDTDIETITADGKIPVYQTWKEQLANKKIGLDALMNISAFYSFATDQRALDDRIKSLL